MLIFLFSVFVIFYCIPVLIDIFVIPFLKYLYNKGNFDAINNDMSIYILFACFPIINIALAISIVKDVYVRLMRKRRNI